MHKRKYAYKLEQNLEKHKIQMLQNPDSTINFQFITV